MLHDDAPETAAKQPTTYAELFQPQPLRFVMLPLLASRLGKPIVVLDLETTTLPDRPDFGICEIGSLKIHPDGRVEGGNLLINPENPIDPGASKVHGIYDYHVEDAPTWGEACAEAICAEARECLVLSFNGMTFDLPAMAGQNTRYGFPEPAFNLQRDVRSAYAFLKQTTRGKLTQIIDEFGIQRQTAHEALGDVIMTAELYEHLLIEHGLSLYAHPATQLAPDAAASYKKNEAIRQALEGSAPAPSSSTPEPARKRTLFGKPMNTGQPSSTAADEIRQLQAIAREIKFNGYSGAEALAAAVGMTAKDVSFKLDEVLKSGLIDLDMVAVPEVQDHLKKVLPAVVKEAWRDQDQYGKLKPVYSRIPAPPQGFDYTQLRIALVQQGFFNKQLRAAVPYEEFWELAKPAAPRPRP